MRGGRCCPARLVCTGCFRDRVTSVLMSHCWTTPASCTPGKSAIRHLPPSRPDPFARQRQLSTTAPASVRSAARHAVSAELQANDKLSWTASLRASFLRKPFEVTDVRSYTFLALAVAAAAGSLFSFNVLADRILQMSREQGFAGPASELQILDVRNGYTPSEVFATLHSWGAPGTSFETWCRSLFLVYPFVFNRRLHF